MDEITGILERIADVKQLSKGYSIGLKIQGNWYNKFGDTPEELNKILSGLTIGDKIKISKLSKNGNFTNFEEVRVLQSDLNLAPKGESDYQHSKEKEQDEITKRACLSAAVEIYKADLTADSQKIRGDSDLIVETSVKKLYKALKELK